MTKFSRSEIISEAYLIRQAGYRWAECKDRAVKQLERQRRLHRYQDKYICGRYRASLLRQDGSDTATIVDDHTLRILRGRASKLSDAQLTRLLELHISGVTQRLMARELGISVSGVQTILEKIKRNWS